MNNYNNDTLPFQQKIVGIKFNEEPENFEKLVEHIALALKSLYGIIFLLFPKESTFIVTSGNVTKQTIQVAKDLQSSPFLEDEIDIIPFPK